MDAESDEELDPFAPHISNTIFPQGFKIPHIPPYDGTTDPYSHLNTFNTVMRASNVSHELRCMLFHTCLTRPAKSWFDKFRRHSIISWDKLSSNIKKQFRAARTIKPEASSLENIKQQPGRALKKYIARFNLEAARSRGVDDSSHLMAIRVGVLSGSAFWEDLQRKPVYTLKELIRRAQHHINVEEAKLLLKLEKSKKNTNSGSGPKQSYDGGKRKNEDS